MTEFDNQCAMWFEYDKQALAFAVEIANCLQLSCTEFTTTRWAFAKFTRSPDDPKSWQVKAWYDTYGKGFEGDARLLTEPLRSSLQEVVVGPNASGFDGRVRLVPPALDDWCAETGGGSEKTTPVLELILDVCKQLGPNDCDCELARLVRLMCAAALYTGPNDTAAFLRGFRALAPSGGGDDRIDGLLTLLTSELENAVQTNELDGCTAFNKRMEEVIAFLGRLSDGKRRAEEGEEEEEETESRGTKKKQRMAADVDEIYG